MSNTGFIRYDVTLQVTWVSNGLPATSYDWQDMTHATKSMPNIQIKNIGLYRCVIAWRTSAPTGLSLTAWRYSNNADWPSGGAYLSLDPQQTENVKFSLVDVNQPAGNFAFNITIESSPA